MKKISIALILLVSGLFFNSCDNERISLNETDGFQNINSITKDEIFVKFVEDGYQYFNQAKDIDTANKLLLKGENLSVNELERLSKALGFSKFSQLEAYYIRQNTRINNLNLRYDLSSFEEDIVKELIIDSHINSLNLQKDITKGNNCERIYRNCMIQAGSAAVVGHIACATIDVTVLGGLICHGAVILAQAAASDNCGLEADHCQEQ